MQKLPFSADQFREAYTVSGRIIDDRIIEITTKMAETRYARLLDIEDQMVREGLIKLGWTPPSE